MWLMIQVVLFVLLYTLSENFWLTASIILGIAWWTNAKLSPYEKIIQLLWLRSDIRQRFERNEISQEHYHRVINKIEQVLIEKSEVLKNNYSQVGLQQILAKSWKILNESNPLGNPPWHTSSSDQEATQTTSPSQTFHQSPEAQTKESCEKSSLVPHSDHEQASISIETADRKKAAYDPLSETTPRYPPSISKMDHKSSELQNKERYALEQASPMTSSVSTDEHVPVQKVSYREKWSRFLPGREFISNILFPFLWQNLGWFIGGLCFVSGTVFLVTYTSGFIKALAVLLVLILYTSMLFWGGYQLRRHRPELLTSSHALFILAVLLVPLNFVAAIRLIENSGTHFLFLALSIFLACAMLWGLTVATQLASGMMDRHLLGRHPFFFIGLASFQFFLFLLERFPYWPLLGLIHLALLGLLSYALFLFGQHWLQALFIDRKFLTYYAVGTLIYAALVSFGHLTWKSGLILPAGYAGSLLMVVTLLLFYVDVQFKHWVHKQAWLDYFIFVVYGLSIIALGISFAGQSLPLITLSLVLGTILYAMMIWHYLTWPPLYLGLLCLSGLYGLHILRHFPAEGYFLLSLPALAGLQAFGRFAHHRQVPSLALISCRILSMLALGLLVSSLLLGSPGWISMTTALVATGLVYFGFPFCLTGISLELYQGYLFTGLATLTLAYMPIIPGLERWEQFNHGLVGLTLLWSMSGVWQRIVLYFRLALLNSALLSLMLYLALTFLMTSDFIEIPLLPLIIAALILLWLSLNLYSRELFYVVLILVGAVGSLFKYRYIHSQMGLGSFVISFTLWGFLQWLRRLPQPISLTDSVHPAFSLLGLLPIRSKFYTSWAEMVQTPLEQIFYLLWVITLVKLGNHWFHPPFTLSIVLATAMAALTTLLVALHSRQMWLLALVIVMGMGSLCALVDMPWWSMVAASYALILWLLYHAFLFLPRLKGRDRLVKIEPIIHSTTFSISLISATIALMNLIVAVNLFHLAILSLVTVFFGLTGYTYQLKSHHYLTLGGFNLISIFLYAIGTGHSLLTLLQTHHITPLMAGLMTVMALLAQYLNVSKPWQILYREPLFKTIGIFYFGILLDSLFLLFFKIPLWLPGIFLLLACFAMMFNGNQAQLVRGLSVPLLLIAAIASTLLLLSIPLRPGLIMSGFILWALGTYLLPLWNARWPAWVMIPHLWIACGFLSYGGSVVEGLRYYETSSTFSAILWIALALAQFPMLRPFPQAPQIRGVGIALFLTLALITLLQQTSFVVDALMGWSFILWISAHVLLPTFNRRWSFWTIEADFWFILGLILITGGLLLPLWSLNFPPWYRFALAALYYFFMLPEITFLAWGIVLSLFGFGGSLIISFLPYDLWIVGLALWVNLLIRGIPFCQYYDTVIPQWPFQALAEAFLKVLATSLGIGLLINLISTFMCFPHCFSPVSFNPQTWGEITPFTGLLALSFLHLVKVSPHPLIGHGLMLSWLNLGLLLLLKLGLILPLALSLWSISLLLLFKNNPLKQVIDFWVILSFILSLLSFSDLQNPLQALFTLVILAGISFIKGLRSETNKLWLAGGMIFFLLFIHLIWIVGFPTQPLYRFFPEYAAQSLLLSGVLWEWQKRTIHERMTWLTQATLPPLLTFSLLTWLAQCGLFGWSLTTSGMMSYLLIDHLVMILTGLLFIVFALKLFQGDVLVYGLAIMMSLLVLYIRLFWVGLVPVTLWDTAAFIGAGYGLLGMQRFLNSTALYRLILLMPMLALLTVPIQLGSIPATSVLFASGILYFLMQRREQPIPLYLGFLVLNLGTYLWIPDLSHEKFWPYTVPACVSVLLMLQLHLLEFRPRMIHMIRMITLSILYASILVDGFLRPEMEFFLLALGLGLGGIILGIALQVRAFLYTGTFFMTLNLLGQLIHFYPEGRLEKAIILITLGMIIMASMIGFNIQREAILARLRIMRADLAHWK